MYRYDSASHSIFMSTAVFQRRWSLILFRFLIHLWTYFFERVLQILIEKYSYSYGKEAGSQPSGWTMRLTRRWMRSTGWYEGTTGVAWQSSDLGDRRRVGLGLGGDAVEGYASRAELQKLYKWMSMPPKLPPAIQGLRSNGHRSWKLCGIGNIWMQTPSIGRRQKGQRGSMYWRTCMMSRWPGASSATSTRWRTRAMC